MAMDVREDFARYESHAESAEFRCARALVTGVVTGRVFGFEFRVPAGRPDRFVLRQVECYARGVMGLYEGEVVDVVVTPAAERLPGPSRFWRGLAVDLVDGRVYSAGFTYPADHDLDEVRRSVRIHARRSLGVARGDVLDVALLEITATEDGLSPHAERYSRAGERIASDRSPWTVPVCDDAVRVDAVEWPWCE